MNRIAAILLLLAAPLAGAQAPQPAPGDIAAVREFLAASGAEKQYDQMLSVMMESIRDSFSQGFNEATKGKPLDAAGRARAQAIADRHYQDLQRDFETEVRKLMPYERLVNDVYGPLYLKQLTSAEIAEATAFFKSPTGRKLAGATQTLMQDASRILGQRYMPELVRTMTRQMDLRMNHMTEELDKL